MIPFLKFTGIGIEGREGRQASLAGDFSITQFAYIAKLLLVHGRRSYKRSAALSQFVIHRGLIISTMQAVFSAVFYVSSVALYQGFLMVGYATIYTMFPVFSLVLDQDISSHLALTYPELYKELSKGRSLSYKTFFIWVLISIYQGKHFVDYPYTFVQFMKIINEVTLFISRWCHYVWSLSPF